MNSNSYKTRYRGASKPHKNTTTRLLSRTGFRGLLLVTGIFALLVSGFGMLAAPPASPALSLDQASNGGIGKTPVDPVAWENGNQNGQKAHYNEGESIPYRARLTGLTPGSTYRATFGYDITHGGGHAIDYITSNDRIGEEVNPCNGTGEPVISPCVIGGAGTIPAPAGGTAAQNVANASFLNVVALEGPQVVSIFNGNISLVERTAEGDLTLAQSESTFRVTFTATESTTVLSWGGHIARAVDWANFGGSATTISGSPFHTRAKSLEVPQGNGFKSVSVGNQDRALASSAVQPPLACSLSHDGESACGTATTTHVYAGTVETSSTYAFSFFAGSGTIDASNTNPSATECTDGDPDTPCIYATVTATGTYTLRLTVSNAAGTQMCDATLTVDQAPSAAAGDDEERCNTGVLADLDFAVSGSGTVPTGGTQVWSILPGGTTTATIADASAFNTTITLAGNGTVTARLTVSGPPGTSCPDAYDDVVLTLNGPPTVSIALENACISGTAQLKATASGGTGTIHYEWSKDGAPIADSDSATLPVSAIGTYSVTVTDGKSCSGSATKKLCFELQNAP